jgi:hypothetical protein
MEDSGRVWRKIMKRVIRNSSTGVLKKKAAIKLAVKHAMDSGAPGTNEELKRQLKDWLQT